MYTNAPITTYSVEKGYNIAFTHVPTGNQVSFPAFLTSFEDSYSSNWGTDKIYGRTDPIYLFQQTTRNISFSIDIPSASEDEAISNFALVRNLTRFLYPAYERVDGRANIIGDSPVVRIKFSNLIGRGADGIGAGTLLGRISTIAISPDVSVGFFDPVQALYPKLLKLSISFDVIHEESPTKFPVESSPVDAYAEETSNPSAIETAASSTTSETQQAENGSEDRDTESGLESNNSNGMSNEEFQDLRSRGHDIYFKSFSGGSYEIDVEKTRSKAQEIDALRAKAEQNERLSNSTDQPERSDTVTSQDELLDEEKVLGSATK